jgi:hypothetical protein
MARDKMNGTFLEFTPSVRVEQFCVDLNKMEVDSYF